FPSFHTMSRKEIADFVMKLPFDSMSSHDLDAVRYMVNELPEWFTDTSFLAAYEDLVEPGSSILVPKKNDPWLNTFYPYAGNMIFVRKKDFFLAVNPILQWKRSEERRVGKECRAWGGP